MALHPLEGPHSIESILRFETGHRLHQMWQEIMASVFPDFKGAEEEVRVKVDEQEILGHPDGIIPSLDAVWEFKSIGMNGFKRVISEGPYDTHLAQANSYAKAVGASNILMHYYAKDDGKYVFMLIPFSEEQWLRQAESWRRVIAFIKSGVIPPRPYHDATASPCSYCPLKAECYSGYQDEIESMSASEQSDPVVDSLASRLELLRMSRLDAEGKEKKLKQEVASLLIQKNLKAISTGSWRVEVKAGKNNNPLVSWKSLKD